MGRAGVREIQRRVVLLAGDRQEHHPESEDPEELGHGKRPRKSGRIIGFLTFSHLLLLFLL